MSVLIIEILIELVLRIITLLHLSTRLSMTVLGVKYFSLWMDFLDITRLISFLLINIILPLSVLGENFPIKIFLLALKMLVQPSKGSCIMLSMISKISFNYILMIYLHTCLNVKTIRLTFGRFFFAADTIISS